MNQYNPQETHTTSEHYSPHSLLPAPEPCTVSPPQGYFYDNVAKHLIKDTVRVMANGLPIDLDEVGRLEVTLQKVLDEVLESLTANTYVHKYMETRNKSIVASFVEDRQSKLKQPTDFLVPFKHNDMVHRSYFMHFYTQSQAITSPIELLPTGIPKWPANTIKKLAKTRPVLIKLLTNKLPSTHPMITSAMQLYSQHRADLHNRKFLDQIANPIPNLTKAYELTPFNPASPLQKGALFAMLGLKSDKQSKLTEADSWDRDEVERINKETTDPLVKQLTQALINHSFGAIIKSTFIPAFYKYTIDDRLYGNLKLFGAKTFRYTSQNPNMLNMPSTRSIYAKPVKKCFNAPPGQIVYAIDLSALEDRVMASLSRDKNKCAVFTDGLDGHCLNAYGYFKDEVAQHMPITGDTVTDVLKFFDLQEHGNTDLKAIRQRGKPATFGLNYGAFPKKVAASLKISLAAAQAIFDSYHNELYGGITKYREEYVLPTTKRDGRIHLGLGCYLKSDDPAKDIRTLNNATCQFWSIVTTLTINKMHQAIDDAGYQDLIKCTSTIYDSIYLTLPRDPTLIKWLNDTIVPIMIQDFMLNQAISNEAAGELGPNWADLLSVPNNASIEQIQQVLDLFAYTDSKSISISALTKEELAELKSRFLTPL